MKKIKNIRGIAENSKRYLILIAITVAFLILYSFTIPTFTNLMTITNIIRQTTVLIILAVGMYLVILTGGIDLSVGSNIALSGVIAALAIEAVGPNTPMGMVTGVVVILVTATLIGLINGLLIGYLDISPFMATLASQYLGRGITLLLTGGSRIVVDDNGFNWLGSNVWSIGAINIPSMIIVLVPIMVIFGTGMKKLIFGRRLYAVGGNPRAAYASGINVLKYKAIVYTLCGLLCGIGGIITVGRAVSAQPLAGINMEFDVITATVMGGVSLAGGVGTLVGTFLGGLMMGVITIGINLLDIPIYLNYLIKGFFVLIAVLSDQLIPTITKIYTKKEKLSENTRNAEAIQNIGQKQRHVMELRNISKSFSGIKVLNDVSMKIESGKVHALVGENGAGKSTLIKILSGVYQRDAGELLIDGIPIEVRSTIDSQKLGISIIYQEFALIPELSVTENIFLGKEIRKHGFFLSIKAMAKRARKYTERLRFSASVDSKIKNLSVSQQQMVEIAKAISSNSWFIIMDEPTSAITEADKEQLFEVICEMKKANMAIVYVSHKLSEVFQIADDITVLRDGKRIATMPAAEANEDILIKYMVGRELKSIFSREKAELSDVVLKVENLSRKGIFEPISFEVRAGEVLGLSGLVGAGRTEIARCVYGLDKPDTGKVWLNGSLVHIKSPKVALEHGICYVSEDRRGEGIIPLCSVKENITLCVMNKICNRFGVVKEKEQDAICDEFINKIQIKTTSPQQLIVRLSGGNQQKCCVAKMLAYNPRLIILDEPTRGIDVGAKAEIHKLIEQLAKQKIAIILISSELPEIIGASDRIIVLAGGRLTGEFNDENSTQEGLMACATKI